jgi:hypothetical protein
VTVKDLLKLDRKAAQLFLGASLPQILTSVYPDHIWKDFKFKSNAKFWRGLFGGNFNWN